MMGSLCSVLLFAIVTLYAYQKVEILIQKKSVDIITTLKEFALTSDDIFSYQNGFNIAVAFTRYDGETEWILDPTYGELAFINYSWGVEADGSFFTKTERRKEHICSREELGLTENKDAAKFMPTIESQRTFVDTYQKKFICLNEEDLFLYGDYDSANASQFEIQLIKCTNRDDCKSEEEIREYFRQKFILLMYNQIRFDTDEFG